jgi:hypothetical protein
MKLAALAAVSYRPSFTHARCIFDANIQTAMAPRLVMTSSVQGRECPVTCQLIGTPVFSHRRMIGSFSPDHSQPIVAK